MASKWIGATGVGEFRNGKEGERTITLTGCALKWVRQRRRRRDRTQTSEVGAGVHLSGEVGQRRQRLGLVLYPMSSEQLAEYECT